MALQKKIELENGIIVNYHRIVSVNKITNHSTLIEVASYTSKEKRQEEKDYYESENENKTMNVFIETNYIEKEYNENDTIKDCYEYIKNVAPFIDSTDI